MFFCRSAQGMQKPAYSHSNTSYLLILPVKKAEKLFLVGLQRPALSGILLQRGIAIFGLRSCRPSWAFPP
jgi:hypothetical protein